MASGLFFVAASAPLVAFSAASRKEILMLTWTYLIIAIAAELFGTMALKLSEGFTKVWWTIGMAAGYVVAFVLLGIVVKTMPVGLAYAVWAGLGTLGAVIISIVFFKSESNYLVWIGSLMIIGGVVVLNLGSKAH